MVDEAYATAVQTITRLTSRQLDAMIARILSQTFDDFTRTISIDQIWQLCDAATNVLRGQEPFIEVQAPVIICGDIHGQFVDLKRIFNRLGLPPRTRYLFLGDIVDRGSQSLETIVLLLCYKVRYPTEFHVLRGNHECASINRTYGFYEEISRRYGEQNAHAMWDRFNQTFAWLPYVGLVANRILCMHGGISPELTSRQQLRALRRPFVDPPVPSLEIDLLWADPSPSTHGVRPNPRGVSVLFGADVVASVCNQLNVTLIVRAHQCVPYGFDFMPGANAQLLTIFSAPNYGNQRNVGAVLIVTENVQINPHFI